MPRANPRSTVIRTSLAKAPTRIKGLDELAGEGGYGTHQRANS
jgi:hypothetical protein